MATTYEEDGSKSESIAQRQEAKKKKSQAGQRTNEGQKQMKERIKQGNMHTYYGFPDTPEGKKKYQKAKKEYGLH